MKRLYAWIAAMSLIAELALAPTALAGKNDPYNIAAPIRATCSMIRTAKFSI
jgi:hypothetical protein